MERSPQFTSIGRFSLFLSAAVFLLLLPSSTSLHPIGIHPLDEKLYESDVIKCKDGSKSFSRDRINDNFCDCPDGTDEPGTPACPRGKFYCRNVGSTPKFLFSSRVNDHFCDCCDGSDEYDGTAVCPNTCVMGGNVAYKTLNYGSKADLGLTKPKLTEKSAISEDSNRKLTGLKILVLVQAVIVSFVVVYWVLRRRVRPRRRHSRTIGSPMTLSLPF